MAAKLVELAEHRDERVVGALQRDVVEIRAVEMGKGWPAPIYFEVRTAQEKGVQASDGLLAGMTICAQRIDPRSGVGV